MNVRFSQFLAKKMRNILTSFFFDNLDMTTDNLQVKRWLLSQEILY